MEISKETSSNRPGRPPKISRETLEKALDELASQDLPNPTYKQIHSHIGGGSMTTLVRIYRELMADRKASPSPAEGILITAGKQYAEIIENAVAEEVAIKIKEARAEAETKTKEAVEEREKFMHMRTLLNERADKAETAVLELKDRQQLHEQELQKYRMHISDLQSEREALAIALASAEQKLTSEVENSKSIARDSLVWREKYEDEARIRNEELAKIETVVDRLNGDLANKTAVEKSLIAANTELKKNNETLSKQLAIAQNQINAWLEQQALQDDWKKDMMIRVRERDDDITYRKKEINKLQAQIEINNIEKNEISKNFDTLSKDLLQSQSKLGSVLYELESEKAAHDETQKWSEKTIRYKDEEINQLRANLAELIAKTKHS